VNLLKGTFDLSGGGGGYRVRYSVPPLRAAAPRPPYILDFGDGEVWTSDSTGQVTHDYAPLDGLPRRVVAVLRDADGVVAGSAGFEVPRSLTHPHGIHEVAA
jgi:hypothetical protein